MTDTRSRLLDAALVAFATRGVEGTSVVELEEAGGLAPGSGGFYRYFKSKDEVLVATVEREIDRITSRGRIPVPATPEDPRAALTESYRVALQMLRSLGPLMAILAREHGRIPELAARIHTELVAGGIRHDAEHLEANLDHARLPDDGAVALGAVLQSALVGYVLSTDYFGAAPGGLGPDQFVAALVDLVAPPG